MEAALRMGAELPGGVTFTLLRELYGETLDDLDASVEAAFGEGHEMLMLVTDLSVSRAGITFINTHGSDAYFAHNQNLQFYERGANLADQINQIMLEEE